MHYTANDLIPHTIYDTSVFKNPLSFSIPFLGNPYLIFLFSRN